MEKEGEREREMKSHQPKQDLTQLNTPYVVYVLTFTPYSSSVSKKLFSHLLKRKHQVEVVR